LLGTAQIDDNQVHFLKDWGGYMEKAHDSATALRDKMIAESFCGDGEGWCGN
jgi:hypothetical protein